MKIECTCLNCGKSFLKAKNEYNRRLRLGKSEFFCSNKCRAKKAGVSNFGDKVWKISIRGNPNFRKQEINPFKYYLRNCRRRFKHHMDIDLNYLQELWNSQKGICPYSGVKLILNYHTKKDNDIRYIASLDRIDNDKGYVKGNIHFISTCINFMKSTMTHEQTIEFIKEIKEKSEF